MHELLGVDSAWPLPVLANYMASLIDGLTLNWLAQSDGAHAEEVLDARHHVLEKVKERVLE